MDGNLKGGICLHGTSKVIMYMIQFNQITEFHFCQDTQRASRIPGKYLINYIFPFVILARNPPVNILPIECTSIKDTRSFSINHKYNSLSERRQLLPALLLFALWIRSRPISNTLDLLLYNISTRIT